MTRLSDEIRTDTGWEVVEDRHVAERAVTIGSNFCTGNGYLGYRMTSPDQGAEDFVGCTVSDTYDMADGRWRELCNAPNGLFVELTIDGSPLKFATPSDDNAGDARVREPEITLDLRSAAQSHRSTWLTRSGAAAEVTVRRFASLADLHLLVQEITVEPISDGELEVSAGIDARVWSLNGDHFGSTSFEVDDGVIVSRSITVERGTTLAVATSTVVSTGTTATDTGTGDIADTDDDEGTAAQRRVQRWIVPMRAGEPVTIVTSCGIVSSNDIEHGNTGNTGNTGDTVDTVRLDPVQLDPVRLATTSARRGAAAGFDAELARSTDAWDRFWEHADVRIEGDLAAQAALRFCLYHNRIATPAHSDRLPIGARGLSCQAYQGAAFWDQEIFNLPAFLFTEPDVARNLLVYRWRTLDGARRKARRLGYAGAFYAWISGDTGDELCPDFFFVDVLTGRPIRNHFNDWQMHVSPDIAFTVWRYWKLTADWDFMVSYGAEILFEVARFLHSFVVYSDHRGRYECRRLLGPDEWHENVDNDAYTNHLVHTALAHAITAVELMALREPDALAAVFADLGLGDDDVDGWRRVCDGLYLPQPDPGTGLIEQFDGFFDLEDCRPADLIDRLADHGEYWGWPNGVAVFTQVSKQPAVVQLFHLDHTFPLEVQRANYEYYEPRCAHGSSLSHSVHALVATRLGLVDDAYRYFWQTSTIDLLSTAKSVVGGTFIGGIHTAACGGAYQAAVFGFGGLDALEGVLIVDPRLPDRWDALEFGVVLRGQRATIRAEHEQVTITADPDNTTPLPVSIRGDVEVHLLAGTSITSDTGTTSDTAPSTI